jgi:CubicO group peptidase (beta-lactamase class C family)
LLGAVLVVLALIGLAMIAFERARGSADGLSGAIDAIAERALAEGPVAGISLVVARRGRIIHSAGYGFADLENRLPASEVTVYRVGSITKQFTAAAIVRLVEEGRLELDAPIGRYLPDFPPPARQATIESLLNHTSGIKNYTTMQSCWETMALEMTPEQLVGVFRDQPVDFAPGTRFSYSNSGYAVLGLLIERVSGTPFGGYLQEHLFSRLGLPSTSYCDDQQLTPNRARGYKILDGEFVNAAHVSMSQAYAAGAVCSSALDLARWFEALKEGAVVSPSSFVRMTQPGKLVDGSELEYGFGLAVSYLQGRRRISHVGGTLGFSSQISHFDEDDVTIVVLTNTEGANAASIETEIARLVLGLGERSSSDILLAPVELARYAGRYDLGLTTVQLSAVEGRLQAEIDTPGLEGRYRLLYQGGDSFLADGDPELSITFSGAGDEVVGFVLVRHGITMRARRISSEPPGH